MINNKIMMKKSKMQFNINTNKPYQLTALNAQSSISEVSNSVENDEFYIVPSGVKE